MTDRRHLPNRRAGEAQDFTFRGAPYRVAYSRFPDGGLAEVFIDCQARGATPLDCDAKDVAVVLSLALQFGTPVEALRAAVTREGDGCPVGIAGAALDLLEDAP